MPRDDDQKSLSKLLRHIDGPAIVVDVARARLEWSNAAARALLGLTNGSDEQPQALDRSTPALVELTKVDANASRSSGVARSAEWRPLTFWIDGRAIHLPGQAARVSSARAGLILVRFGAAQDAEAEQSSPLATKAPTKGGSTREADWTVAPLEGETIANFTETTTRDAATLKEIARRIREGAGEARESGGRHRDLSRRNAAEPIDGKGSTSPASIDPVRNSSIAYYDLASIAHELRTPLNAIAAFAELMRDEKFGPLDNARYRGYVRDILESSRHALDVISGLMEPATATSGPSHAEPIAPNLTFADLDLNEITAAMVSTITPLAEEAGLHVSTMLVPQLPHVVADGRSLRQILLNLLTNALKFTGTGGSVTVRTNRLPGGDVIVEVEDTGIGINPDAIDRALAGKRLHSGTSAEVGLGLPLVKTLAEANGARVEIESAPAKGTRVTLAFPPSRLARS